MATTALLTPLVTASGKTGPITSLSPRSATKLSEGEKSIELLWHEARVLFLSQLSTRGQKKEVLRDETATLNDTIRSLKTAQERASQTYGDKFKGTPVEFKLGRALKRLDLILRIGDQAMQFAPETASYAWAAIRMIATGVLQSFQACEFVVDATDQTTDLILTCLVYARRQVKSFPVFTTESQMLADKILEKIPPILALVLQFAYTTRKLFVDKGPFGRTISLMMGVTPELKEIISDALVKRDALHRVADIAFHEAAIEVLQSIHADTEIIRDSLKISQISQEELLRVMRNLEAKTKDEMAPAIKAVQIEQAQEKERRELENDWGEQLQWLRSGRPAEVDQMQEML